MTISQNLLSNQNTKLMKDGIYHFSIPAFRAQDGFETCPGAGRCARGCYARQGFHYAPWVKNKQEFRLKRTLDLDFAETVAAELERRRVRILRIHEAGDFYSTEYLYKWFEIMHRRPTVTFYAYTKMIPMMRTNQEIFPPNFTVIFSLGGKWDSLIDISRDRHARVFEDHESLERSGYADATRSDLVALSSWRIGLVYHGGPKLNWVRGVV